MIAQNRFLNFVSALCVAGFAMGCDEAIEIDTGIDESAYQTVYETNGYLVDATTGISVNEIVLGGDNYESNLTFGVTGTTALSATVTASYDTDYISTYNAAYGTSYEAYPSSLVTIGSFSADASDNRKATASISIIPSDNLQEAAVYAVPVAVSTSSSGITLKSEAAHCLYIIDGDTEIDLESDCFKGDDLPKGFLYFEVNDTNPLNALAWKLDNGKILWDVVCLFAANINYDSETKRAYVYCNPQVQFLLDNNEEYLQPLRRHGIKVLLGILGNHDESGVCQLSDEGARDYASQLAAVCEAYNLDGVNFDDEYSNSPDLSNPYFSSSSSTQGGRLCYETKRAMPDKIVSVFSYSGMSVSSLPLTVDDVDISEWIDIAVANYGSVVTPKSGSNMTYSQCSGVSFECNLHSGSSLSSSNAQKLLSTGYGWFMAFCLDPSNFSRTYSSFASGAELLYGSALVYPEVYYEQYDTTPYAY